MIIVDTSVWVDHLRRGNETLSNLLSEQRVLAHPFVIGELALGGARPAIIEDLLELPSSGAATAEEVLGLVGRRRMAGRGIGYVDARLIASALLMGDAEVWTLDKSLQAVARDIGVLAASADRS